ncbi:hypothetical protein B0J15DRAFT_467718 [Fusarium solani]|uniref:Uncharacterized protein n=1 Tax=Fusarium solani TaxID=169388 RepID=A0A9P9H684_FUSSL|nr:uncharacterized protein B0J15DRAFT_467718 [Fusarium solani]KAH7250854.1 hypothetical protein B0J15DRAFT_467718 [Fusarium solani]
MVDQVVWSKSSLPQLPGETVDVKDIYVKDEGTVTLLGAKGEHVAIKSDIGEVVEVVVPGIFASRGQHRYRRQSLRQVVASQGEVLKGHKFVEKHNKVSETAELLYQTSHS